MLFHYSEGSPWLLVNKLSYTSTFFYNVITIVVGICGGGRIFVVLDCMLLILVVSCHWHREDGSVLLLERWVFPTFLVLPQPFKKTSYGLIELYFPCGNDVICFLSRVILWHLPIPSLSSKYQFLGRWANRSKGKCAKGQYVSFLNFVGLI